MRLHIKSQADLLSGVMFIVIGVVVVWAASQYRIGTAVAMGPGYFPRLLGGLLALLGLVVAAHSFVRPEAAPSEAAEPYPHTDIAFPLRRVLMALAGCAAFWITAGLAGKFGLTGLDVPVVIMLLIAWFASRELFWVLAAIAAFAVTIASLGLVMAIAALMFVAQFGSHESKWRETLIGYFVLLGLCLVVFIYGLNLNFPVLPEAVTQFLRAR